MRASARLGRFTKEKREMAKTVQRSVHVQGRGWFHKGDQMPDDVAERITNPSVFADPGDSGKLRDDSVDSQVKSTKDSPYGDESKTSLQRLCAERDLPQSGTKTELIARLEAADAADG